MSLDVSIMLAPIYTLERANDPRWNHCTRTLYDPGSLKLLPGKPTPLLVDHLDDRRVGTVNAIASMEWSDGPWLVAHATVDDPPSWLRQNDTKASFGFIAARRSSFTRPRDADHIRAAIVSEVSLLAPGTRPVEPRARVLTVSQPATTLANGDRMVPDGNGGTIIYHGRPHTPVRRNIGKVVSMIDDDGAEWLFE